MDPAGYDALIRDLSASMGKEESAELEKVRKIYDGTSADAEEEYWCNRFGELLQDPEKLRRFSLEMEMKNAGMARRILIRVREYIRSILDAMGGKDTLQERRLKRADEMVGKILDNLERKIGAETTTGDGIAKYSISGLYTGSSADYDRPSLHYVGTGEGSQVYGWGLYASSERGVAESYLPPKNQIERANQYREYLKRRIAEETDPHEKGFLEFNLREAEKARPTQSVYEQTFFTNRAPGDESHLLKWYEPVSEEQFSWIAEQALAEGWTVDNQGGGMALVPPEDIRFSNATVFIPKRQGVKKGMDIYMAISTAIKSPKAASEFLARAGIDGVKYPVGSFNGPVRDGDEAGWNYVSFRDDNIRVDHKWVDGEQKFSVSKVTPEQDAEYMEAVKNGDMEKARKMLIDAASEKGIVLDDGRMMYYRSGKLMYDDSGEVEDSFVIELVETPPEDRGQGIARKLLAAAFQKAGDEGLSATGYAYAQDDDTDQERLVDFYERIGFSVDEYDMVEASGDTLETGEHPEPLEVGKKDDAGDVIPLSKRFKTRNYDPRYSVTNYPAFHAWTGDWEDRNIYGKLHGDPVAFVENGVIKVEKGERGVIDAAKRWIAQHPQEPAHTEIGDVVIDVDSMQGSMSHSRYQNKLTVIPILKEALEKGEYLGALPDWTRNNTEDHYFAAKVRIGEEDKILFIRVLEPAGLDKSLYVHEIYTDEELNEKRREQSRPGMQTGNTALAKIGNHSDFFRKVIRLFYLSNPESTKAVDSNGRPLVVWRRDDEIINVYDFSKTQKTDAGWLGKGFYFYGDKVEAERATGYGKHLRGFYIDAKNPYYMSDEEHAFLVNADSKEKSADFTERLIEEGYDSVYYNGDLRQEWVVFEPSQIKLADETTYDDNGSPIPSYMRFSESDDNRYSVTEDSPARRKDLLAAHNLSESALRKAIQLGGFPMPSIAVFKDTMGHSHYGGISLLFAPSTIDPKAGRKNVVYSGDAWTPTFPEIRFEASGEAESRIYGRYEELRKKAGNDLARPLMKYGTDLQDELNRHEGSAGIIDREMNDADMAKAFLADNGRAIPDPVFDERTESLPEGMSDIYERVVSRMGRDVFKEVPENIMAPLMQKWLAASPIAVKKPYSCILPGDSVPSKS